MSFYENTLESRESPLIFTLFLYFGGKWNAEPGGLLFHADRSEIFFSFTLNSIGQIQTECCEHISALAWISARVDKDPHRSFPIIFDIGAVSDRIPGRDLLQARLSGIPADSPADTLGQELNACFSAEFEKRSQISLAPFFPTLHSTP
jgi:hypothetical protein